MKTKPQKVLQRQKGIC